MSGGVVRGKESGLGGRKIHMIMRKGALVLLLLCFGVLGNACIECQWDWRLKDGYRVRLV